MEIEILTVADSDVPVPYYATAGACGADLYANNEEEIHIEPLSTALIPTGLKFAIPPGFEMQIRPRSGLALKHQITVLNSPGTIDCDFRGEVKVILLNLGKEIFIVRRFDRIAQAVISPVCQCIYKKTEELDSTLRSEGGFGSTGV